MKCLNKFGNWVLFLVIVIFAFYLSFLITWHLEKYANSDYSENNTITAFIRDRNPPSTRKYTLDGLIWAFIILFFTTFVCGLSFGPGIWKRYHHNKKIFFVGYALSVDESLYDKELSSNSEIRKIEQQIIKKDHLVSKMYVLYMIFGLPVMTFTDYIEFLILRKYGISNINTPITYFLLILLIWSISLFFLIHIFILKPRKQLIEKKLILEKNLKNI